jgi:hypothetical protein
VILAAGDPNWILSTTAQSTAALVAIVAGFLLSRMLALATERSGLTVRTNELQDAIWQVGQQIGAVQTKLDRMDLEWFDDDAIEALLDDKGADVRSLLTDGYGDLAEEKLHERFEMLRNTLTNAYSDLGGLLNDEAYQRVVAERDLSGPGEEIYAAVWRQVKPRRGDPFGLMVNPIVPPMMPIGPTRREVYSGLLRDRDTLVAERDRLAGAAAVAETRLAAVQTPAGLGWAQLRSARSSFSGSSCRSACLPPSRRGSRPE